MGQGNRDEEFFVMKRIFIISHNHKIAFMHVSKTGSTTIAKMIIDEEYPTKELHDMDIWKYCKTLKPGVFSDKYIDGYKVYCFVRNPFSRVYASFRHYMRGGEWSIEGKRLKGYTQFNDFVKNHLSAIMVRDRHFQSMQHFIGLTPKHGEIVKFENFNNEMERIWGSKICHENAKPEVDYRSKYNSESIDIVKRLYQWDIETLGYEF